MRTFTDVTGRPWAVTVTVDTIRRVRSLTSIDLLEVVNGTLIERLAGDPVLLCDVLYAVVKPEADTATISDIDFGRLLAGDTIEHATRALLEGLVDFFPNPRRRLLAKALEKLAAWQDQAVTQAELALDQSPPPPRGDSSGAVLASSASIPPG